MRKIAFVSFLSSMALFAEQTKQIDDSMPWLVPWLIASLLSVGVVFWGIYKSMKTQNHKYGYAILVGMLILVGLLFL